MRYERQVKVWAQYNHGRLNGRWGTRESFGTHEQPLGAAYVPKSTTNSSLRVILTKENRLNDHLELLYTNVEQNKK